MPPLHRPLPCCPCRPRPPSCRPLALSSWPRPCRCPPSCCRPPSCPSCRPCRPSSCAPRAQLSAGPAGHNGWAGGGQRLSDKSLASWNPTGKQATTSCPAAFSAHAHISPHAPSRAPCLDALNEAPHVVVRLQTHLLVHHRAHLRGRGRESGSNGGGNLSKLYLPGHCLPVNCHASPPRHSTL